MRLHLALKKRTPQNFLNEKKSQVLSVKWIGLLFVLFLLPNIGSAQNLDWIKNMGGSSQDIGYAITTDDVGNVFTTGRFLFTADFNPGDDSFNLTSATYDIFISKLNTNGDFAWAKQIEGSGVDCGNGITVDGAGNIYVTGYFAGTADFDPGSDSFKLSSHNSTDAFILKLDSSGNFLWARNMGGSGYCYGLSIDVDSLGNVYTIGRFSNTVDFNPSPNTTYDLTSAGKDDIFISKLDANGNFVWAKSFGSTDTDYGNSISVDASGNIYATGWFSATVDFDSTSSGSTSIVISNGKLDIFILKLNSAGDFVWVKSAGGPDLDYGYAITLDDFDNVYVTGNFSLTSIFNAGASGFILTSNSRFRDVFVAKLDIDGNYEWVKKVGSSLVDYGQGIDTDGAGNVYVGGSFNGEADFDPGADSFIVKTNGGEDIYALKLNPSGEFVWVKAMGSMKGDNGYGISLDPSSNVYVTGSFTDTLRNNPLDSDVFDLITNGKNDIFVFKLVCNDTSFTQIKTTECKNYVFNGITYSESGVYSHRFTKSNGCDSIIELNLTVKDLEVQIQINVLELSTTLTYSTYQWMMDGETIPNATNSTIIISQNGDYQVIVSDEDGCVDTSDIYKVTNMDESNIKDVNLAKQIRIYPNPSKDMLHIQSPIPTDLSLFSIEGKQIPLVKVGNQIFLNDMGQGIYFLKIYDKHGNLLKVEKILKVK